MKNIILASGSPRRKQLLELAEIPFVVIVSDIAETYPADLNTNQIPQFIAEQKALAVQKELSPDNHDYTIIAADTIVCLNGQIIGKPRDRNDAIRMLSLLSGDKHEVLTGVCILFASIACNFVTQTFVEFNELSQEQIEFYVDKYAPYDKAGAYAIQEWIGAVGVKSINGDFYNVMGLPINRVVEELTNFHK